MVNHPNRSKLRDAVKITLSNSAGPLDERIVRAKRNQTDDDIAQVTAQLAVALILETNVLYPGDSIKIEQIE